MADTLYHAWYSQTGYDLRRESYVVQEDDCHYRRPYYASGDIYYLHADTQKWVLVTSVTESKDNGSYAFEDKQYVGPVFKNSCRHMTADQAMHLNALSETDRTHVV